MKFEKPPLSFKAQIDLLKSRGLIIPDEDKALRYLSNISYYRLSAYMFPLQIRNDINHNFKKDATFEKVLNLYVFDRHLRLLIFDCIERVEIAFRTQLIYYLSHSFGSHWYLEENIFSDKDIYENLIEDIKNQCESYSKEVFIKHYRNKYNNPILPPSWMCIELLSMGQLSKMYKILSARTEKKEIANHFGVHELVLTSWMHTISYIRNICAHHSRLWNRELAVKPKYPKYTNGNWLTTKEFNGDKIYGLLAILKFLLNKITPQNSFTKKLVSLLGKYDNIDIKAMGFPNNWSEEKLWKD